MVRKCDNKEGLIAFVEQVEAVLFCNDCQKSAKELFISEVDNNSELCEKFFAELPSIKEYLKEDLDFFLESDPASDSKEEIRYCYPGFKAITYYRIAHVLSLLGLKIQARIISEQAHVVTGIDIHPGATIGHPFFIDHGTGIVIGETSFIGNFVKLYQGVTLGALSLKKGRKIRGEKRHPTIGNYVTIYANASILGGQVTIGNNVVIGGNVYLTESVPDNYKVLIQKPELLLIKK